MPKIQVLSREEPKSGGSMMDKALKFAEFADNARYKQGLLEYNRDLAKIQAKTAASEIEKRKFDMKAKTADLTLTAYKQAVADSTTEQGGVDNEIFTKRMGMYMRQLASMSPESIDFLNEMQQLEAPRMGEQEQVLKSAQAAKSRAEATAHDPEFLVKMQQKLDEYNASKGGGAGVGGGGQQLAASTVGGSNATNINAINGTVPSSGMQMVVKDWTPGELPKFGNIDYTTQEAAASKIAAMQAEKREGLIPSDQTTQHLVEVKSGLDTLGASLLTLVNNPDVSSRMGPWFLAGPQRALSFNDPDYQLFNSASKAAFAQYRKIITGAQASKQELDWLENILGKVEDMPNVFLVKNMLAARLAANRVRHFAEANKATFRDTSSLDAEAARAKQYADYLEMKIKEFTGGKGTAVSEIIREDFKIEKSRISKKDQAIMLAISKGATYDQAQALYLKWLAKENK